jgi:2-polyprenyl-3-methyl-5-hydroxy-6-metoxy-1,4-benzoquinol methylase
MLEIGCGNGGMTRLLAPQAAQVVALDLSTPSLAAVDALSLHNVEVVQGLVEHYQPETRFDWIIMSEVIEHLRQPGEIIARCVTWLAPGGSLLLTTPNGHWESNEHLQEFSLQSLSGLMAQSSAEQISVGYIRDTGERRRWLAAQATAAQRPYTADSFNDQWTILQNRRSR